MQNNLKLLLSLLSVILLMFSFEGKAQEVVATNGDFFQTSSGSLSWTLGEVEIATYPNGNYTLTQGFQQNYESILQVESLPANEVSLYPNPFNDVIMLSGFNPGSRMEVRIWDSSLKEVEKKLIEVNIKGHVIMHTNELSRGVYFLEGITENAVIFERIVKLGYE